MVVCWGTRGQQNLHVSTTSAPCASTRRIGTPRTSRLGNRGQRNKSMQVGVVAIWAPTHLQRHRHNIPFLPTNMHTAAGRTINPHD